MSLNAGYAGMGGAQAAIAGSRSTETDVITDLRKNALAFAAEYHDVHVNRSTVQQLANNLEGSLRSLHAISAISESTLVALLKELNMLVDHAGNGER